MAARIEDVANQMEQGRDLRTGFLFYYTFFQGDSGFLDR